jgi:hypothetical protein
MRTEEPNQWATTATTRALTAGSGGRVSQNPPLASLRIRYQLLASTSPRTSPSTLRRYSHVGCPEATRRSYQRPGARSKASFIAWANDSRGMAITGAAPRRRMVTRKRAPVRRGARPHVTERRVARSETRDVSSHTSSQRGSHCRFTSLQDRPLPASHGPRQQCPPHVLGRGLQFPRSLPRLADFRS